MAGQITKKMQARMDKVATLLLDVYKTLAEMCYLDPAGIIKGPHTFSPELQELMVKADLDPAISYLHSVLPYVDREESGQEDFFRGGRFCDLRQIREFEHSRDPLFCSPTGKTHEAEDGLYMRPWYTPLSALGNHESVIIYDARKHRIWLIDQENHDTSDPVFSGNYDDWNREEWEARVNKNSIDWIKSRPAEEFLHDLNKWFRTLEFLPGGYRPEYGGYGKWMASLTKPVYRACGWPKTFDGRKFLVMQARAEAADRAKYFSEEPLRKVKCYEGWIQYQDRDEVKAQKKLGEASTPDEEWLARYQLWEVEQRRIRNHRELKEARETASRLCPEGVCQKEEDLPVWEHEQLRDETKWKITNAKRKLELIEEIGTDASREKELKRAKIDARHSKLEAEVYGEALIKSKEAADRLCPGRTFFDITGMRSMNSRDLQSRIEQDRILIKHTEIAHQQLQDFGKQIPDGDLPMTRKAYDKHFDSNEIVLARWKKEIEEWEAQLAEGGSDEC